MALEHVETEVQVKLVELAWEAAKKGASTANTGSALVKQYTDLFGEALDGFVRSCESAGKERESK